ncbi:MAG: GAF domain-containing protein, partial [Myxococcales bacterium]|nr:GAF domain-containing protein [Myxococcales bacterium]
MNHELHRLATSLRDVTGAAIQIDKVGETIQRTLAALAEAIPHELSTMSELVGGALLVRAVHGRSAQDRFQGLRLPLDELPGLRSVLDGGRPTIWDDEDADDDRLYRRLFELPDERSALLIPIVIAGERLGLLTLDRARDERFEAHHVDIGAVHAQIIGLALAAASNANRIEELQAQLEEQKRYLTDEVASDAGRGLVLE